MGQGVLVFDGFRMETFQMRETAPILLTGKKVALSVIHRRDSQNYGIKIVMSMKFVAPNRMVWEDESTPSDILGANTQFQGDQILASSSQKVEEMEGIVSMVVEMSPG